MIENKINEILKNKKCKRSFPIKNYKPVKKPEEQGLIVAAGERIYALEGDERFMVSIIALRDNNVNKLLYNNNVLYDLSGSKIRDTLTDKIIFEAGEEIIGAAFRKEVIYCNSWQKIYDTSNKKIIIDSTRHLIHNLISYDGRLYHIQHGENGFFDTLSGKKITTKGYGDSMRNLISHKNKLYYSSDNSYGRGFIIGIKNVDDLLSSKTSPDEIKEPDNLYIGYDYNDSNKQGILKLFSEGDKLYHVSPTCIFETINKKIIANRKSHIKCIKYHNGKVLDSSLNKIFDTYKDQFGQNPLMIFESEINDMCNVPMHLFNKFVNKGLVLNNDSMPN
ncbi:MAG: hypothetical protein KKF74_00515 [Nanoarchaeota archaeon]|nr:hypothetical protein [Nanoarchaeota archaeon]